MHNTKHLIQIRQQSGILGVRSKEQIRGFKGLAVEGTMRLEVRMGRLT